MRLSCTPVSILRFFLITSLTLFLKPDARAQSMLAANSLHHSSYNKSSVEIADGDPIQSEAKTEKYSAEVDDRYLYTANFLRRTVPVSPSSNSCRIFTGYHPPRVRIYSACIQHSMSITVKFFKVVIVPLWYARRDNL